MEFHYPEAADADLDSDVEEDFLENEVLLTRRQLRSMAAELSPSSSLDEGTESGFNDETQRQCDGETDARSAVGMEAICAGGTEPQCDGETQVQFDQETEVRSDADVDSLLGGEKESQWQNIEGDSDNDEDSDFTPETDQPPRKKKRRFEKYKWVKSAPTSREQTAHSTKPHVKCDKLLEQPSALNCFLSLFSEEALKMVVDMTNKNYLRKNTQRSETKSAERDQKSRGGHTARWSDVTVPEMKAFVGLLIAMGMVQLPEVRMYWRQACRVIRTVGFGEVMSRGRFEMIYQHLCIFDPDDEVDSPENQNVASQPDQMHQPDPQNGLEKIRNFSEIIRRNCINKYASGRNLAIDEAMIPFSGHVVARDFPNSKRHSIRSGIKIWTLVESETSYVSNFQFYAGRDPQTYVYHKSDIARDVVMGLMEPFFNEGRHLYVDTFYTSPELLEELHERGTYACGTVTQNIEGFPKDLVIETDAEKCYSRGYFDWRMSENIVCYSWFDKKPVYFMSTIHLPDQEGEVQSTDCTVKRRWRRRVYIEIACPTVVKDYDRYMRAIEDNSQFCKYFNFNRKCRVWYRKAFGYLLEVCVHNSRVLWESLHPAKGHGGILFRESLVTALVDEYTTALVHNSQPQLDSDLLRQDKREWHLPMTNLKGRRLSCRYCMARAKASMKAQGANLTIHRSSHVCSACNVTLCVNRARECFKRYHEDKDFWP